MVFSSPDQWQGWEALRRRATLCLCWGASSQGARCCRNLDIGGFCCVLPVLALVFGLSCGCYYLVSAPAGWGSGAPPSAAGVLSDDALLGSVSVLYMAARYCRFISVILALTLGSKRSKLELVGGGTGGHGGMGGERGRAEVVGGGTGGHGGKGGERGRAEVAGGGTGGHGGKGGDMGRAEVNPHGSSCPPKTEDHPAGHSAARASGVEVGRASDEGAARDECSDGGSIGCASGNLPGADGGKSCAARPLSTSRIWLCSQDEHRLDRAAAGCWEACDADNLDDGEAHSEGSCSSSEGSSNALRASWYVPESLSDSDSAS